MTVQFAGQILLFNFNSQTQRSRIKATGLIATCKSPQVDQLTESNHTANRDPTINTDPKSHPDPYA